MDSTCEQLLARKSTCGPYTVPNNVSVISLEVPDAVATQLYNLLWIPAGRRPVTKDIKKIYVIFEFAGSVMFPTASLTLVVIMTGSLKGMRNILRHKR
jgi:hypothetical protein